jgi:uncharacterized protein
MTHDVTSHADDAFRAFVDDPSFPCLAGKGVVNVGGYALGSYGALGSMRSAKRLARDLSGFLVDAPNDSSSFRAFVAVFQDTHVSDEQEFERLLWLQLQRLHERDTAKAQWAPGVSDDPAHPAFSFSFGGTALFIVGVHPRSSRLARQFKWPALVFNPHEQFQRLRAMNRFDRLRSVVREREIALQGSLNPNLADFGEQSEARQYSGRHTQPDWQCPFHRAR